MRVVSSHGVASARSGAQRIKPTSGRPSCRAVNPATFHMVGSVHHCGGFQQPARVWGKLVRCPASSGDFAEGAGSRDSESKVIRPAGERERSMLVNEEVVYFIFQLDLDTQLQRCLNYEAYEVAQEVRKKRQRVDEAVAAMRERKARNTGQPAAGVRLGAADWAAEGLRLRSEMQRAVEAENYSAAARYRDLLRQLDQETRRAAALAAEWDTAPGGAPAGPRLRLGQRVLHRQLGYRGVVVGWDPACCESEDWAVQAKVEALRRGTRQPFYHLLVDARDWEYDAHLPPVAYVAEELLTAPELESSEGGVRGGTSSSSRSSGGGRSWSEVYGSDPLQHPYMYILFLGVDGRGDCVPCRQLRDKYNVARRDVYRPGEE
ncbi:hypothetical protein Agub_g8437, partial [Astrephomene gubernaculifera]